MKINIYNGLTNFLNYFHDQDLEDVKKDINIELNSRLVENDADELIESALFKKEFKVTKEDVQSVYNQYKASIESSRESRIKWMDKFLRITFILGGVMMAILSYEFPIGMKMFAFYAIFFVGILVNIMIRKSLLIYRLKSHRSHNTRLYLEKSYPQYLAQKTTINKVITYPDEKGKNKYKYSISNINRISIFLGDMTYVAIAIYATYFFITS